MQILESSHKQEGVVREDRDKLPLSFPVFGLPRGFWTLRSLLVWVYNSGTGRPSGIGDPLGVLKL